MLNPYQRCSLSEISIQKMFKTARPKGAIKPKLPQIIATMCQKNHSILDYGAGKLTGTFILKENGFDVTPYDVALAETYHSLERQYDVVMASSVLNLQESRIMVVHALSEIFDLLVDGGVLFVNYPQPRHSDVKTSELHSLISIAFTVEQFGGTKQYPFWKCQKRC
jgi:hypothetical protein